MAWQPLVGKVLLIVEASPSQSYTPPSRSPVEWQLDQCEDLYLATHNTLQRQASMPWQDWDTKSQQSYWINNKTVLSLTFLCLIEELHLMRKRLRNTKNKVLWHNFWNHTFIFIAKPYFLSEWTYTFGYFLHHYHNNNYYTRICVVSVHISFSYKTVQNTMLRNLKDNNSFGYQPVTI